MDNAIDLKWVTEQIRNQRHDFMNYIQVIYGYLQINRPNDAIEYIKKINKKMIMLSQIYNIDYPIISLLVQDIIGHLEKKNIDWEIKSVDLYIAEEDLSKNIHRYIGLYKKYNNMILDNITKIFQNEEVDIYICNLKQKPAVILINNMLSLDEIEHLKFETIENTIFINNDILSKAIIIQLN